MLRQIRPVWWLGATLLAMAAIGCSDDDGNGPPSVEEWPFPDTEDQVIANFKRAYSEMDIGHYGDVLNDGYKFIFQQTDIQHLNLPSDRFNRDGELATAARMFARVSPSPDVPAISSIAIDVLEPQNAWQEVIDDPYFPNSWRRPYQITMYIERPGATTLKVEGLQELYVVQHEFTVDGSPRTGWQLVGQVDLTLGPSSKTVESNSWGSVKALYADPSAWELPFPDTEDQVIENFARTYGGRDLDGYGDILHENYKFLFQQSDIEHLGLPYDHFNRDEELGCAANMFSGVSPSPDVPAISSISIDVLEPQDTWQDVSEHPDFPNSRRRPYQITMYIERPGATTFKVEGLQNFYVVQHEFTVAGSARMGWQLVGRVDHTVSTGKAVGSASWGVVKSLYWGPYLRAIQDGEIPAGL